MHRCITPYDPLADAAERWPDWTLLLSPLGRITAVYSAREKTIVLNADLWRGRECEGFATAVAHLDLGHHEQPGGLRTEQIRRARGLAQVRLDQEDSRILLETA